MNKEIVIGIVILFVFVGFQPAFANNIIIGIEKQQPLNGTFMKTFGGGDSDSGRCVQQTTDGGYIITGSVSSLVMDPWDFLLIKTNKNETLRSKAVTGNMLLLKIFERFPLIQKLIQQLGLGL
jgi:hypothetical protein